MKENELFHLTESNRALTQQLQDYASKKSAPSKPAAMTVLPEAPLLRSQAKESSEIQSLKNQLKDRDKWHAQEEKQKTEMAIRIKDLERDLRTHQSATDENKGKPIDPVAFMRWKDRAVEGRKMYQMMKQLRDLSDQKIENYQRGLSILCKMWIAENEESQPQFKSVEGLGVDALFAKSLQICMERQKSNNNSEAQLTISEKIAPNASSH